MSDLQFPGYGLTQFGERKQADGSVLSGHAVEVPHAGKQRILVYRSTGQGYDLIDDFITPFSASLKDICSVALVDRKLIYTDLEKNTVLTQDFREQPR